MATQAIKIFQYLRGAIRATYGQETLRDKAILFVGMGGVSRELLRRLCLDGVALFFMDHSIHHYYQAHTVCGQISPYKGEAVDIILDIENKVLTICDKQRPLVELGQEPYVQGIHDFYL